MPYSSWERCVIRLGVVLGNLQKKKLARLAIHLSIVIICGISEGVTWKDYVIYDTLIVWSLCSLLGIDDTKLEALKR